MTPQKQAKELVNIYYSKITGWKISFIKKLKVTIIEDSNYQTAKQCALIAVDEILKLNLYIDTVTYWHEVKAEINKL